MVRVIREKRLYVYNMRNTVQKHLNISIAPVRSQGGSLVLHKLNFYPERIQRICTLLLISVYLFCQDLLICLQKTKNRKAHLAPGKAKPVMDRRMEWTCSSLFLICKIKIKKRFAVVWDMGVIEETRANNHAFRRFCKIYHWNRAQN
jgi:hypothetical protein